MSLVETSFPISLPRLIDSLSSRISTCDVRSVLDETKLGSISDCIVRSENIPTLRSISSAGRLRLGKQAAIMPSNSSNLAHIETFTADLSVSLEKQSKKSFVRYIAAPVANSPVPIKLLMSIFSRKGRFRVRIMKTGIVASSKSDSTMKPNIHQCLECSKKCESRLQFDIHPQIMVTSCSPGID